MTHKQFSLCISEAPYYTDGDTFASDLALSAAFAEIDDLVTLAGDIHRIWDALHMSIRDLRSVTGLSQVQFAERFLIPRRTVENWEAGTNECPIYTRMLLADAIGLLPQRSN